jgi:hypothetical protein
VFEASGNAAGEAAVDDDGAAPGVCEPVGAVVGAGALGLGVVDWCGVGVDVGVVEEEGGGVGACVGTAVGVLAGDGVAPVDSSTGSEPSCVGRTTTSTL